MDTFNVEYVREYYNDPLYASNVENDAVIARALQEELSRIAYVEASGFNNTERESIITQHWPGPHETYHGSGTRKFRTCYAIPWLFVALYSS
jgi:hypothetical protein